MRIALIAPFGLRAKGTARARALPLARTLAARGHDAALFVPPYDSPEDSGRRWNDAGVDVINLAVPVWGGAAGPVSVLRHFWLAWRLLRAVLAWRPEVVHVFKPKGPSGLAAAALWATRGLRLSGAGPTQTARRPCLVVDSDDWEGPGGWNDDPRTGYSPLQKRFFAWQERFGLSHADGWTVTSACLRQRAIGLGADPARVTVLHNGADSSPLFGELGQHDLQGGDAGLAPHDGFRSGAEGPGWRRAVLYTRFAGVRPDEVVAIWSLVRQAMPDAGLTVIGRGLGGEEGALAGLPGIDVKGWVEPEQLPGLLARADAAMAPWADTPSNRARHSAKVLELMAAGRPVVAYTVGELPVTLGETGILVPPGETAAFAAALAGLLGAPEQARALGAAARARVWDLFTWQRLGDVALEAYRSAACWRKGEA